jgi:hypothetical protein
LALQWVGAPCTQMIITSWHSRFSTHNYFLSSVAHLGYKISILSAIIISWFFFKKMIINLVGTTSHWNLEIR